MKTAQLKAAVSSLEGQIAETTNAIRELKSQLAFAIQMSGKNANKGGWCDLKNECRGWRISDNLPIFDYLFILLDNFNGFLDIIPPYLCCLSSMF